MPWVRGQSGNPAGRRPGIIDRRVYAKLAGEPHKPKRPPPHAFRPGESGNYAGRPRKTTGIRPLKRLTKGSWSKGDNPTWISPAIRPPRPKEGGAPALITQLHQLSRDQRQRLAVRRAAKELVEKAEQNIERARRQARSRSLNPKFQIQAPMRPFSQDDPSSWWRRCDPGPAQFESATVIAREWDHLPPGVKRWW